MVQRAKLDHLSVLSGVAASRWFASGDFACDFKRGTRRLASRSPQANSILPCEPRTVVFVAPDSCSPSCGKACVHRVPSHTMHTHALSGQADPTI
jgi:hypothetical protein